MAGLVLAIGAAWLPLSSKQAEYTNAIAKKYAGKNVGRLFVAMIPQRESKILRQRNAAQVCVY